MNNLDRDHAYADALRIAATLPTWVLRRWERHATRRATRNTPPQAELVRLLAVRTVLRKRTR